MKALLSVLVISLFTTAAFAAAPVTTTKQGNVPAAVLKAAGKFASEVINIHVTAITNTDGNPCLSEGKSYMVDIQVRNQVLTEDISEVKYEWETVKTINIDKDGSVMELCRE